MKKLTGVPIYTLLAAAICSCLATNSAKAQCSNYTHTYVSRQSYCPPTYSTYSTSYYLPTYSYTYSDYCPPGYTYYSTHYAYNGVCFTSGYYRLIGNVWYKYGYGAYYTIPAPAVEIEVPAPVVKYVAQEIEVPAPQVGTHVKYMTQTATTQLPVVTYQTDARIALLTNNIQQVNDGLKSLSDSQSKLAESQNAVVKAIQQQSAVLQALDSRLKAVESKSAPLPPVPPMSKADR